MLKNIEVIILGAGKGTRLRPLTKDRPKSLIKIDKKNTIIEKQIDFFSQISKRIIYVYGYKGKKLENYINRIKKNNNLKVDIKLVYNPFYNISNNLISLWLGQKHVKSTNILISNGDNIYSNKIIEKIKNRVKDNGIYLTMNTKEKYNEDDMKIIVENDKIKYISKKIKHKDANGESVGLIFVKGKKNIFEFKHEIEEIVKDKKMLKKFWLEVFNKLISKGVDIKPLRINKNWWREVDFHSDIEMAKKFLKSLELEDI